MFIVVYWELKTLTFCRLFFSLFFNYNFILLCYDVIYRIFSMPSGTVYVISDKISLIGTMVCSEIRIAYFLLTHPIDI